MRRVFNIAVLMLLAYLTVGRALTHAQAGEEGSISCESSVQRAGAELPFELSRDGGGTCQRSDCCARLAFRGSGCIELRTIRGASGATSFTVYITVHHPAPYRGRISLIRVTN
jgi:hypothetical protein